MATGPLLPVRPKGGNDGGRISRHRPDGQGHGGEPAEGRTPGACMGQVIRTIARHRCGELGCGLHLPHRSEVYFRGNKAESDGGTHERSSTDSDLNGRDHERVADLGVGLHGTCLDLSAASDLSAAADLARRSTRHHRRRGRVHPRAEFEHGGRCSGRSGKSGVGR